MIQKFQKNGNSRVFLLPPDFGKTLLASGKIHYSVVFLDDGSFEFTLENNPVNVTKRGTVREVSRSILVHVPKGLYLTSLKKNHYEESSYIFVKGENDLFSFIPVENKFYDRDLESDVIPAGTIIKQSDGKQSVVVSSQSFNQTTHKLVVMRIQEDHSKPYSLHTTVGALSLDTIQSITADKQSLSIVGQLSHAEYAQVRYHLEKIFNLGGN